jgi:hypothetical protein
MIALLVAAALLTSCGEGSTESGEAAPSGEPTATAVAGRVSISFTTRCVRAGNAAALTVDYRASATEEKRLVRITIKLDEDVVYDSGDIDKNQETGSRVLSVDQGSRVVVEVRAMPQDGRFAAGRKTVACPGTRPGFRA